MEHSGRSVDKTAVDREPELTGVTVAQLRSAFANAPIGVAVTTLDGVVIACNEEVGRLLDRPHETLPGTTFFDVTHPDDHDDAATSCGLIRDGRIDRFRLECRFVRPDGTPRWMLVSTARVAEIREVPAHLVMHIQDIDDRKGLEAELVHRASHDSLTGLPNRSLIMDRIGRALVHARRSGRPLCLLFVDIDGFKRVNDTYGHAAGDLVLQQLAHRFTSALRPGDTAARLGGDEFVVLCEDATAEEAPGIVRRLEVIASAPYEVEGKVITISATIGITVSGAGSAEHAADAGVLLRRADRQMYEARSTERAPTPDG